MTKYKASGFTLIELLVVIAIIGVLTTIAVVSLADIRTKARDTKRTTDIKQIGTALETYFAEYGYYPTIITPGEPLASPDGTTTYIAQIPSNPTPREDNGCPNADYAYTPSDNYTSYTLSCCIGTNVSDLPAGTVTYTPSGWSGSGEIAFANCGDNLTYGGESYPTVQIGTQCWFAKNLNIGTMILGANSPSDSGIIEKYCMANSEEYCNTYGGLYQWSEAMALSISCATADCHEQITTPHQGICPTGWHVPTDIEFNTLEQYTVATIGSSEDQYPCDTFTTIPRCADDDGSTAGGPTGAGKSLKAIGEGSGVGAGDDLVGFSILLGGYRSNGGWFESLTSYTNFWLVDQHNDTYSWRREFNQGYATIQRNNNRQKTYGYSVRCLKD